MDITTSVERFVRAANYLTVTQMYLQDNFLLDRPLEEKDIKQRLFGHWGTCPGINFLYAHLNHFVKKSGQSTMFILGPGHGFPALQANLFLEGTLGKYYPQASRDEKGIAYISKAFTWPYQVSSHSNPEAPGLILEGGELGYSLATAYGSILDNPDLLAVTLIGDGEAESGPLAAAWHINKLIDPATNGAVLPVLHVNGYKISGPSIFGRMSDEELHNLFSGYGYEPFFVGGEHIYQDMITTLDTCLERIKTIQKEARSGNRSFAPHFPMIIMQTPKGWTGVKELYGKQVEGGTLAHQVVAPNARKDDYELSAIDTWLKSYGFGELFDKEKGFAQDILDLLPDENLRIGDNPHVYSKKVYKELVLPKPEELEKKMEVPGKLTSHSMKMAGQYMEKVFSLNSEHKNFRLMSPDETYSNRLDDVFKVTARAFAWPHDENDRDMQWDGRVMEMLSEHNLHGLAQGYILTGRHAMFTTYEAFAQIFSSMTHQYEKFLKVARTLSWRGDVAAMNYLLSSVLWRQEHNGFTHQNPSFISSVLEKHDDNIVVYFPADDNSMLAVVEEVLRSKNGINTIVAGKTVEPRWMNYEQAKEALKKESSIWEFASNEDPDIVLVGIGDYMTREAMAALEMVKVVAPEIKIRFVNVMKIHARCGCKDAFHPQIANFAEDVTEDKPVIVNFHGYPETVEAILFSQKNPERFSVHGYQEFGGTTTPMDLMIRNNVDRYHLAIEIVEKMKGRNIIAEEKAQKLHTHFEDIITKHYEYVMTYGTDPIELEEWHWDNTRFATDDAIQLQVLKKSQTVAIIGLSSHPDRYSYKVAMYLQSQGMKVIPIHPESTEVLGEKAYASLADIPEGEKIDMVAIYRRSEEVLPHVEEVLQRGNIPTIWLPEGVRNKEAEMLAQEHGIILVSDFCLMKEYQRMQDKSVVSGV